MAMRSPSFEFLKSEKSKHETEIRKAEQAIEKIQADSQQLFLRKVYYADNNVDDQLAIFKAQIKEHQNTIRVKKQVLEELDKKYNHYGEKEHRDIDRSWYVFWEEMNK